MSDLTDRLYEIVNKSRCHGEDFIHIDEEEDIRKAAAEIERLTAENRRLTAEVVRLNIPRTYRIGDFVPDENLKPLLVVAPAHEQSK